MLRFAADENLHGEIYNRLRTQLPDLDIIRIQDSEISGADDEIMLGWVASENRLLLTHDKRTIVPIFSNRLAKGQSVPGVFMINNKAQFDLVVTDLLLIIDCSTMDEWTDKITYLPL